MMDPSRRGRFDEVLFAEYRSLPEGTRKRRLASQLVWENEPLIITLVQQLRGEPVANPKRRRTAASRLGGCGDLGGIDFEDAMQAGRMAMAKALDQYDPACGKLSFYLLMKIRYELQRISIMELHLARTPKGREKERLQVGLVGMPTDDNDRTGGDLRRYLNVDGGLGGLVDVDVSPEDLAGWEASGEWPESLEEVLERRRAPVVYSFPTPVVILSGWERFIAL